MSNNTTEFPFTPTELPTFEVRHGFYFAFLLLICVVGSFGNVKTIIAVRAEKRLRDVISNYFVINLAVADFIVCAAVVPLLMAHTLQAETLFTPQMCYISAAISGVACHTAAATMTCIALNRFIATYKFQSYESIVTKPRIYMVIVGVWAFAVCNTIPILYAWFEVEYDSKKYVCVCFDGTFPLYYTLMPVFIGHFIPHAITAYCYFRIFRSMKRSRCRVISNAGSHGKEKPDNTGQWSKHEKQMFKTSLWIIGFFSFCWIPYGVLVLLQDLAPIQLKKVFGALCLLSFSLNPIIYGLLSKSFRKAYRFIINKALCNALPEQVSASSSVARSKQHTMDTVTWKSARDNFSSSVAFEDDTKVMCK